MTEFVESYTTYPARPGVKRRRESVLDDGFGLPGTRSSSPTNVMDFIPAEYHADLAAGISTADLSAYINQATSAAGEFGAVQFPQWIRGRRLIVHHGQQWFAGTIQLPPGVADYLVVDNYWLTNNPVNSNFQRIYGNLKAATLSNTHSSGRAFITGSISGNALTVSFAPNLGVNVGRYIQGGGITGAPTILAQVSGTTGGSGVYTISGSPQTVASAVMQVGDYYPGGVGWLINGRTHVMPDYVEGFDIGIQPTSHLANGTLNNSGKNARLYTRPGTQFINNNSAIMCTDNTVYPSDLVTVTDCTIGPGTVFGSNGTDTRAVISIPGFAGWDICESVKFFSSGSVIMDDQGKGCRNVNIGKGNFQLNPMALQDPGLSPQTVSFFKLAFDSASEGAIRLSPNIRFDPFTSQHTYRIFDIDTTGTADARLDDCSIYESDMVLGGLSGFDFECLHVSDPTTLVGISRAVIRSDFTFANKGNGWPKVGSPPALLTLASGLASFAVSPYTDPFIAYAGPRCLGGNGQGLTRYQLYDAMLAAIGPTILAKLDAFVLTAATDPITGSVNLASPGTYTDVSVNAPTFTADRGYLGNGTTQYLDTGLVGFQLKNYISNSASFFVWTGADFQSPGSYALGSISGGRSRINPRDNSNNMSFRAQGTMDYSAPNATTRIGMFGWTRTTAPLVTGYINGVSQVTATDPGTVLGNTDFTALLDGTNFSIDVIQGYLIGGTLSGAEVTTIYNAVKTYLTAIGAPT